MLMKVTHWRKRNGHRNLDKFLGLAPLPWNTPLDLMSKSGEILRDIIVNMSQQMVYINVESFKKL